jgi:hypothetical protein
MIVLICIAFIYAIGDTMLVRISMLMIKPEIIFFLYSAEPMPICGSRAKVKRKKM